MLTNEDVTSTQTGTSAGTSGNFEQIKTLFNLLEYTCPVIRVPPFGKKKSPNDHTTERVSTKNAMRLQDSEGNLEVTQCSFHSL